MNAIMRNRASMPFSTTWVGMSVLGWVTGSVLYMAMILITAYLASTWFHVPFGRRDVIIVREVLSLLVFGASIGLSQASVLRRWHLPRWPALIAWSLGLPLGWALGLPFQASWGRISASPASFLVNLAGYTLITIVVSALLTFGWYLSGRSVAFRWSVARVISAAIAFGAVASVSFVVFRQDVPTCPYGIFQLVTFPILVGLTALIAEGFSAKFLEKDLLNVSVRD